MTRLLFSILCTGIHLYATSQTKDSIFFEDTTSYIFHKVETDARFKSGDKGWNKFITDNLDPSVPVRKKAPAGVYTVIVQFIVGNDGKLSDFRALTNWGYGMEEEVIRMLKKSPPWEPAIQRGRFVKAYRKQPIVFQIVEEERKRKKNRD